MGAHDACADLWSRTDMKPADVDVLALYDGFSIFVPYWLEAFGFCGHGEAKDFLADGHIGPGGRFPVTTRGGPLPGGRLHGRSEERREGKKWLSRGRSRWRPDNKKK